MNSNINTLTLTANLISLLKFLIISILTQFFKIYQFFPVKGANVKKEFKYNTPFGRKLFNYNSFCKNFSGVLTDYSCFSKENNMTQFIDKSSGHIITGNLNTINNLQLRNVMSLGTKFKITSFNNKSIIIYY